MEKIKIIESHSLEEFEELINKKLSEGWKLYQGMEVSSVYRHLDKTFPHEIKTFYQMIIKEN